jgi:hypothetical protein
MHALECLQHQDNPENQSEQADEIEEKCASRESSPAAKSTRPPMHAKDRLDRPGGSGVQAVCETLRRALRSSCH